MLLILPFILGAAALVSAGFGVASGVDGISKMQYAEKIGKKAQNEYKRSCNSVEKFLLETNTKAEEYGHFQLLVTRQTIKRFVDLIEHIGQRASQSDTSFLEELEGASAEQIGEYKSASLEAEHFLTSEATAVGAYATGGATAAGAAYAAGQGTIALVGLFRYSKYRYCYWWS
jgi:hypothetical protein